MSIHDKTTAHVVAVNTCMRALGDLEGLTYEQTRAALVRALYKPGDFADVTHGAFGTQDPERLSVLAFDLAQRSERDATAAMQARADLAAMTATAEGYRLALDAEGDAHVKTALRMHSDERVRPLVLAARAAVAPCGKPRCDCHHTPELDSLRASLVPFAKVKP